MPLITYCGNILEQEADVIVVPRLKHSSYLCPLSREIYDAADYYYIESEYSKVFYDEGPHLMIEKDLCKFAFEEDEQKYHPNMVCTQGCDLKQDFCFHLEIEDEYTDYNIPESYYFMRNCYMDVLGVAFDCNVKSIVFPLLASCMMGISVKEARELAEDSINEWLRVKEKKHGPIDMKIYLVCDATDSGEKFDAFNSASCFLEYENQFQKKLSEAADPEYLMGSIVHDRMEKARDSNLSLITGMDVTTINRIKNQQINLEKGKKRRCPHKDNVLILAVAMKLNDYDRYEFIRCLKHDYPETEQDFQLEKILRSGVTEFRDVNMMLYGISPELALMPPDKVPEPIQKKEKKSSRKKNSQKKRNKDPEK